MKRKLFITLGAIALVVAGAATTMAILRQRSANKTEGASVAATSTTTKETTATDSAYQTALSAAVDAFGASHPAVGLVVIDKTNSATASYNADKTFVSASLYKLFVAYAVLREIDAGTLDLTSTLPATGTTASYCLDKMITISDNDCARALGKHIGWDTLDTLLQKEGYTSTTLNNYDSAGTIVSDKLTTPKDVALLLERLYDKTLLSNYSTELFMNLLAAQTLNYALPTGLDSSLSFAHKTGILDDYSHDAGFLTSSSRDCIVVAMTDGWTVASTESIPTFTELGHTLSTYMLTEY